jgi:hypothetical protein
VAAIVRGVGVSDCNPLLRPATDISVGTDILGRRFCSDNLFQSWWRLYLERRPIQLTAEDEEVRRLASRSLRME